MFSPIDLLKLFGWSEWVSKYIESDVSSFTFGDLVFDTLPLVLQLFFIVFFLNWIMSIISDTCRGIRRGGR